MAYQHGYWSQYIKVPWYWYRLLLSLLFSWLIIDHVFRNLLKSLKETLLFSLLYPQLSESHKKCRYLHEIPPPLTFCLTFNGWTTHLEVLLLEEHWGLKETEIKWRWSETKMLLGKPSGNWLSMVTFSREESGKTKVTNLFWESHI